MKPYETSKLRDPRSVAITGASSGIGEALARLYAAPGVTLALAGRDAGRIEAVAAACRETGAEVVAATLDVTDMAATAAWIAAAEARAPLDLVIANAGISGGSGAGGEDAAQTRDIFAVNLAGVVNTVMPAVASMRARRRGQIAIVSSLAGYRGLPGAPAYSASKAAVKAWGEGLRGALRDEGIKVSVICPGFVTTRMTAHNTFPMPFLMSAERAAAIIRRGLARNRGLIAFPPPMAAMTWLFGALPGWLADPLTRALPAKD